MTQYTIKPRKLNRMRVMELLGAIRHMPLVIITGAMGYGKTTAVLEYMERNPQITSIWMTFRENDSDDDWIWQRLCDKLRGLDNHIFPIGFRAQGMPRSKQEILHFIDCVLKEPEEERVVVLDDFHRYRGTGLQNIIEELTYADIPSLHIVLISRTQPRLPYEEMIIKNRCIRLEQYQLSLTRQELFLFFKENGFLLSEADLQTLYDYTDGWIAAAYLALLDYAREGRINDLGSIDHLMKTSVFDKMDESARLIFAQMSLFDGFTAEQAGYITRNENCASVLKEAKERNCFLKQEATSRMYEIHYLLKNVASIALESYGIDKKELYNRCGEWYEEAGRKIRAIQNYNLAGNTEKILKLLKSDNGYILCEQAPYILKTIFEAMDIRTKILHPRAYLLFVYYFIVYIETDAGKLYYQEIMEYLNGRGRDLICDSLLGELKILESYLVFNDLGRMRDCAEEAVQLLKGNPSSIFTSNMLMTFGVPEVLTLYHNRVGNMEAILKNCREYNGFYTQLINNCDSGWDIVFEAEYELGVGNYEAAVKLAERACQKAKFARRHCIIISGMLVILRACLYYGDKDRLLLKMKELSELVSGAERRDLQMDYELVIDYIYGRMGQSDKMAGWVKEFDMQRCNGMVRSVRTGCITYGLFLCSEKRYQELEALAGFMGRPYSGTVHIVILMAAKVYGAIAAMNLYGMEQAEELILDALQLGERDELKLYLIENSEELMPLYAHMAEKNNYIKKLMPFFRQYHRGIGMIKEKGEKVPLSGREAEVMKMVASGHSNGDISREMHIALVTVEKTLSGIYKKLEVKNRTMAISKLRDAGIL